MAHIPYSLRTLQKWPYHLRHAHAFVHACWIKLNIHCMLTNVTRIGHKYVFFLNIIDKI